ncbi:hypothetical protein BDZ91DRAFT_718087 [Kalaharituber pfeilii]|nr:hypothetical protein BDZ91DRAFT_718087 [Kalaharituber pfeilii]
MAPSPSSSSSSSAERHPPDPPSPGRSRRLQRPPPRPIVYLVAGPPGCGKTTFLQTLTRADPALPHPPHRPYVIRSKNPRPVAAQRTPELHLYEDRLPWLDPPPISSTSLVPTFPATSSASVSHLEYAYTDPIDSPPEKPKGPDILLLCYDISSRASLTTIPALANALTEAYFPSSDSDSTSDPPILLLGLKRDLRSVIPYSLPSTVTATTTTPGPPLPFITPHEGLTLAKSLFLTRYMECASLPPHVELMDKVEEDVVGEGIKAWVNRQIEEAEKLEEAGFFGNGGWEGCWVS